jgi:hypothetical protein
MRNSRHGDGLGMRAAKRMIIADFRTRVAMRSMVLLVAAATVALCGACARKDPPASAQADAGSSIGGTDTIRDFGAVVEGDKLKHTFVLSGSHGAALPIDRIETNAPWVTAELKKNTQLRDRSEIEVSVDTLGHTGDLEKRISLLSSTPNAPAIQLYVRARVEPLIEAEESEEEEEDEFIRIGDQSKREVWFSGARASTAHVTIDKTTNPDISAELIHETKGDAARQGIRVTVKATTLGHFHGGVILSTDLEKKPKLTHFFEWTVLGNVEVAPRALHFETGAPSQGAAGDEKVAVIKSRVDGFEVRAAKSSSAVFSAEVRRTTPPGGYELHVRVVDRNALARTEVASVELSTNDPVEPVINVPITVSRAKAAPAASSARPRP